MKRTKEWKKRTISGHFFVNYMNIFHKNEVQTVILMGLKGLNLNWFNSDDIKYRLRSLGFLANSETNHQNLQLINGRFSTISGYFFAN